MADLTTLQTWLTAAESAYQALLTGSQAEEVEHSGTMRIRYTRAQAGELAAYIDRLKSQIAAAGGTVTGERRRAFDVYL